MHIAAEIDLRLYLRHPWVLLAHAVPRAAISPSSVACFDWLVEALNHLTGAWTSPPSWLCTCGTTSRGAGLGAVGRVLVAPGSSLDGVGFVAGLADNPDIADLPRMNELVALERPDLCQAMPLMQSGIDALCDGFAVRYGAAQIHPPGGA